MLFSIAGLEARICGGEILKKSYISTGREIFIHFKSDKFESSDGFRLLVTAFREGKLISHRIHKHTERYTSFGFGDT